MASAVEKKRVRSSSGKKEKSAVIKSADSSDDQHVKEFVEKTYAENKRVFDRLAKL